jgi:hypothetical protein
VRPPEKNTLPAIRFDFAAKLVFRLAATQGFEVFHTRYPAPQIQSPVRDELTKLMLGQPTNFI